MPSELQLHPMKLKCKLEYKSHYMYDMIHSDHVISAITWLKEPQPIRKYFQQHLLNVDGRFAQNIEYLFCAQYIAAIKQIESDATLAIKLSQGRTLEGNKITAGHL